MASIFGGLLGEAEKAVRNRQKEIDKIVAAADKQVKKQKKDKNG